MCHWKNHQPSNYHVSMVSGKRCKTSKCVDTDYFISTSSQLYCECQLSEAHWTSNTAWEFLFVHRERSQGPGELIPASNGSFTAPKTPGRCRRRRRCFSRMFFLWSAFGLLFLLAIWLIPTVLATPNTPVISENSREAYQIRSHHPTSGSEKTQHLSINLMIYLFSHTVGFDELHLKVRENAVVWC